MQIESNIPMPIANRTGRGRPSKYPFAEMKKGDSFHVPAKKSDIERMRNTLSTCAYSYVKNNKKTAKFATRMDGNGIRVWRIK